MASFWAKVVVWSLFVGLGMAYNCYYCQDQLGKNLACENNVDSVLQPNCSESFVCIKYIWKSNGSSELHRGCAPKTKCLELQETATDTNVLTYCETCEGELCNSGFSPSYVTSLTVACVVAILRMMFT